MCLALTAIISQKSVYRTKQQSFLTFVDRGSVSKMSGNSHKQ